jgi:hypothetical protein
VRQPQFRSGESRSFLPTIAVRLQAFFARRDFDLFLMYIETFANEAEILARYSVSFVSAQGGVESCLPNIFGLGNLCDLPVLLCSIIRSLKFPCHIVRGERPDILAGPRVRGDVLGRSSRSQKTPFIYLEKKLE